jgi:hypothetical protein
VALDAELDVERSGRESSYIPALFGGGAIIGVEAREPEALGSRQRMPRPPGATYTRP